jgi:UDP-N-acetylmuramyl pentapeptide phosphotransferase/UDP-N-acetylglucosamine-1-phosphate transferase
MTGSSGAWPLGLQLLMLAGLGALISAVVIILLRPVLVRYALARPNSRSSHVAPTPQGGGIAVVIGTIAVVACAVVLAPALVNDHRQLTSLFAAAVGLALVGVTDDIRPLEAAPRLILQAIAIAAVIAALPSDLRILSSLPWWIERALLLIGGLWFVNLVNFMDGIDWITVAEVVPVTAALAIFGLFGALPAEATIVSVALCGALLGFAPFNRPVAGLFLGDVGSLPIGLLLGWLLAVLAGKGHFAAAVLLPLYYLADATITLFRRLANGERITQAHRSHFYQRAIDGGFTVYQVVGRVFAVNVALIALASMTFYLQSRLFQAALVAVGCVLVGLLLRDFVRAGK